MNKPVLFRAVPGLVLVAGVLAVAALLRLPEPAAVRAVESPCVVAVEHRAGPPRVVLGSEAAVTLTLQADCSRLQQPVHVAFVLDNSVGMGGPRMEDMRRGVRAFVDTLDFSTARMGLAKYHSHVEILSEVTADAQGVKDATQYFGPRPGSNLAMAVRAGRQMLERGRAVAAGPEHQDVLILLVGTPFDSRREDVLAEAALARNQGMLVVTLAAGNADLDTLQAMASGPSFFYSVGISSQYPAYFRAIADDLTAVHITGAQVQETLAANMPYVWGSGIPAPRVRSRDLSWLYATWPAEGVQITLGVQPTELGRHPVIDVGEVRLTVDRGPDQVVPLPVPELEVVTLPTATPLPPTVTAPPATATPPPPTPRPVRLFLPWLARGHCRPMAADIVLLLDVSSSMTESVGGGQIKLDAAQDAASLFVDALDLPNDRAAVVTYSHTAHVLQPLSGHRGALQTALARLHGLVAPGSRLDRGLEEAAAQLAGSGRRSISQPVLVVLTDGQADLGARSLAIAGDVRARGVALYTIGLGVDVDEGFLAALAGETDRFFLSPDGADLVAIYLDIARRAGCSEGVVRSLR